MEHENLETDLINH